MHNFNQVIVIGGGAAGFFSAINIAENFPTAKVILLEKTQVVLSKVRISGGGRCNVTHACFDPKILAKSYPRGSQALIGPFNRFQPRDTINWFEERGVELKVEEDGRMFPVTNSSQTIIDCLISEAKRLNVEIKLGQKIEAVEKKEAFFQVRLLEGHILKADAIVLATGSSSQGHAFAKSFGHSVVPPVPSLFTFNVPSSPLLDLAGISVSRVILNIENTKLEQEGPLLLTHWGFSGPAALKLSAWGARCLHDASYQVFLIVNWIPDHTMKSAGELLTGLKLKHPSSTLIKLDPFSLPKNLWKRFLEIEGLDLQSRVGAMSNKILIRLAEKLTLDRYKVEGKTTYKQEFVTAGGVSLDEVNFKTMESKLCSGLYFAGEILDVDGITGGFNFQNAWTSGWIVANG